MNLAFIQGIGPLELVIVLAILLLVLGPKRLPGLGRSLGSGMREFKASITNRGDGDKPAEVGAPVTARPSEETPAPARVVVVDERPLEGEVVPERR